MKKTNSHQCQHTRRSCCDSRAGQDRDGVAYTRRRWVCRDCKKKFSTIEVEIRLTAGQNSLDALKAQYGKQIDRTELNRAIELLGRIKDGKTSKDNPTN